jgi:hypothetical protein
MSINLEERLSEIKTDKPFLVFATPRSGSTIFTEAVFRVARDQYGCEYNFRDYFSPRRDIVQKADGSYISKWKPIEERPKFGTVLPQEKKFQILQTLPKKKYLFKLIPMDINYDSFPNQENPRLRDYLIENYYFICLQRRNKQEQIWSWAWMNYLNYSENINPGDYSDLKPGSVHYEDDWYRGILWHFQYYREILEMLPEYTEFYYEDLDFSSIRYWRTKSTYPMEKSGLFSNKDKILRRWKKDRRKIG